MRKLSTWAPILMEAEQKELSALQKDWREYFKAKLEKFGISSPADLTAEKKADFFNEIKKDWERGKGATDAGKADIEKHGVKEGEEVEKQMTDAVAGEEVKDSEPKEEEKSSKEVNSEVKESEVNEADIKTEEEFREYATNLLKKAHKDDYDENKAKEAIDGILSKSKGDFGAAIGMLTSGLG